MKAYVIFDLWVDPMENHPANASGWKVSGVTLDRAEAERIVAEAPVRSDDYPLFGRKTPTKRFEEVDLIKRTPDSQKFRSDHRLVRPLKERKFRAPKEKAP